jgi:D-glycero-D-manno-heptose 1,7-bisphosphate phosphatase
MNSKQNGKAVFLDRDGVINALVYHQEQGIIDSPFTVEQFGLLPHAGEAVRKLREMGYKLVLVSNQPGIAKGHLTGEVFEKIREKMEKELARDDAFLDAQYYCFHHPEAVLENMRVACGCRKPRPGLLLKAAEEMQLDLSRSWMIGDGLTDIQAGKSAGARTILIGKMKCELCHYLQEDGNSPEAVCADLLEATGVIENECEALRDTNIKSLDKKYS